MVVKGWWSRSSQNSAVNNVSKRIHWSAAKASLLIHSQYIPSAKNTANKPSQGVYGDHNCVLPCKDLGDLAEWLVDFNDTNANSVCLPIRHAVQNLQDDPSYMQGAKPAEYNMWDAIKLEQVCQLCTESTDA
jgi:hypothetical protein